MFSERRLILNNRFCSIVVNTLTQINRLFSRVNTRSIPLRANFLPHRKLYKLLFCPKQEAEPQRGRFVEIFRTRASLTAPLLLNGPGTILDSVPTWDRPWSVCPGMVFAETRPGRLQRWVPGLLRGAIVPGHSAQWSQDHQPQLAV